LQLVPQPVVRLEERIQEGVSVPEANQEVLALGFRRDSASEASPGDQQALVCAMRAYEPAQRAEFIDAGLPRLDLGDYPRTVETHWPRPRAYVDSLVNSRRTHRDVETLGVQNRTDQRRKLMPCEAVADRLADLFARDLLDIRSFLDVDTFV
jgi:hypothetical protein